MYDVSDIRIDTDEDGFWLVVDGNEDDSEPREAVEYRFRIEDAEQLYDRVKAAIGPWLYEREQAFKEFKAARAAGAFACVPDESGGYDLSDPKHPRYHSIHADLWDMREKNPDEYEYLRTEAKREAAGDE